MFGANKMGIIMNELIMESDSVVDLRWVGVRELLRKTMCKQEIRIWSAILWGH